MAAALNPQELRTLLSTQGTVRENQFALLQSIAHYVNDPATEATGRELVLRALEQRAAFASHGSVLDALVRSVGLFPYADPNSLGLRDSIAYEFHRPLGISDTLVFHREQGEVYRRLMAGDNVILSAPTSFGKSRIIDALIAGRDFVNVAVIVPTLALIDETRRRLSQFAQTYKIITHLSQHPGARNLFILTPERAIAFDDLPSIQFFVIDEFYKIGALEEDQPRTVALNQAFYKLLKGGGQYYLLGPNIHGVPPGLEAAYRCHFFPTTYSTVVVETVSVPGRGKDLGRLIELLATLREPTLVYCSSPDRANKVGRAMLEAGCVANAPSLEPASDWIGRHYHPDWVLARCLPKGIGLHHGRLPRSLGQHVVKAFNDERIRYLICTSTLIEGVNTKAKNVVIWDSSIAKRPLDFFTFNNIRGRSGRMFQHFIGRVYLFDEAPQEELAFVDFPVFTQGPETPAAILMQMSDEDLSEASRRRVGPFARSTVLSAEVIRANKSIDPDAQIALAAHIDREASTLWSRLAWSPFPKGPELALACHLIWEHLVDSRSRYGVRSAKELAFRTWQLYYTRSTRQRIESELRPGPYAARSADEAVERVLTFDRNWAGFELPRLLMGLSSIQREVLGRRGYPAGDYSAFATQLESLFRAPVLLALDEYGIPMEIGEKILPMLRTRDDLDVAIQSLRAQTPDRLGLTPFEKEILQYAMAAL